MSGRAVIWVAVSAKEQSEEERFSLPVQEADARAWCASNGYAVIDVLRVPGHSRWYYTVAECAVDMRKEGIDAFDKLLDHIAEQDFDVLVCRDADRFGRRLSILSEVVARVIDSGARIYALSGGWFDAGNHTMQSAMAGYKAANHVDFIRTVGAQWRKLAPLKGVSSNAKMPFSHRVIRNDAGKMVGMEFDPAYRQIFDDIATLLLEGIGWNKLEHHLYHRYGHGRPGNRPYARGHLYQIMLSPVIWGHVASGHRLDKVASFGEWIFEPGHPLPDGVVISYNAIEPVYSEPLTSQLKAELARRHSTIKGRTYPQVKHAFAGLVRCDECGLNMTTHRHIYFRCHTRHKPPLTCTQSRLIRLEFVQAFIENLLLQSLQDVDAVFEAAAPDTGLLQMNTLQHEINRVQDSIRVMIAKQAKADESVQDIYSQEITGAGKQLAILRERYSQLQNQYSEEVVKRQQRQTTLTEIQELENFWQQPPTKINQLLHRWMGNYRIYIRDGAIVDFRKT